MARLQEVSPPPTKTNSFAQKRTPDIVNDMSTPSTPKNGSREPSVESKVPRGWRDRLPIAKRLPTYAGPYSVGVMEIEVPVENPRSFAIHSHYKDLLQLETILMCIYYPSALGSGVGDDGSGKKGWSRQTWLPRPRRLTANGYAKFAGVPTRLAELWFAATTMPTKLPAFRNAPLAEHWAPEVTAREGGLDVKNQVGEPPAGFNADEMPTFPLMMFSHGLGGSRTAYSTLCGEFASFGFIVCALEHRDGSCSRTCVLHEDDVEEYLKEGDEPDPNKTNSPRWVDYIFPKDNPFDTSPTNEKGVDLTLRDAQLEMRKAEISEAYQVMCKIRNGEGEEIARSNLRRDGHPGSSSRGLRGIDWSKWKDRFHLQQVTMMGHSFGAATTSEVLRNRRKKFPWITQGIIYDVWGAPIRPASATEDSQRIDCPLLGINTEAFMYWEDNFEKAMSLVKESALHSTSGPSAHSQTPHPHKEPDSHHLSYLLTVPGTVHISQSDFPLLYPHIVSSLMHPTISPRRAIEINVRASLEFLRRVLPERIVAVERASKSSGLLTAELLDEMPTLGKPLHPNHIAMRLRRPNRMVRNVVEPIMQSIKGEGWGQEKSKKIEVGKDDVWMHFAPDLSIAKNERQTIPQDEDIESNDTDVQASNPDLSSLRAQDSAEDHGHPNAQEFRDRNITSQDTLSPSPPPPPPPPQQQQQQQKKQREALSRSSTTHLEDTLTPDHAPNDAHHEDKGQDLSDIPSTKNPHRTLSKSKSQTRKNRTRFNFLASKTKSKIKQKEKDLKFPTVNAHAGSLRHLQSGGHA